MAVEHSSVASDTDTSEIEKSDQKETVAHDLQELNNRRRERQTG